MPAGELARLARPIEVFRKAQQAYLDAAAEVSRLRRELRTLTAALDLDRATKLDVSANDTRRLADARSVGISLGRQGAVLPAAALRALERAEQMDREDEAYWAPIVHLSAQCKAARAKRRALVGIWEAAFQRLNGLLSA